MIEEEMKNLSVKIAGLEQHISLAVKTMMKLTGVLVSVKDPTSLVPQGEEITSDGFIVGGQIEHKFYPRSKGTMSEADKELNASWAEAAEKAGVKATENTNTNHNLTE